MSRDYRNEKLTLSGAIGASKFDEVAPNRLAIDNLLSLISIENERLWHNLQRLRSVRARFVGYIPEEAGTHVDKTDSNDYVSSLGRLLDQQMLLNTQLAAEIEILENL